MLHEREDGQGAEPTAEQLAEEVAALVREWLPPGRTVSVSTLSVSDRVAVLIERGATAECSRRTWLRAFFVGDRRREGGVMRAAGAALHHAGLEVAAFRVWRGERPEPKPETEVR